MKYYIHPSHEGYGDKENQPHVHVCFGSKSDKSTQVSVSLETGNAIVTGRDLRYRDQKEAEDFVKNHLYEFRKEWNRLSNNKW